MAKTLQELGATLRGLMYDTLCGGDGSLPPAKNSFITWAMPGLPYQASDFDFAAKGIASGKTAEDVNALGTQAFSFATQVDFIPNVSSAYTHDQQQGVYRNDAGMRLSELYGQILKASKVVQNDPTPAQQAKIDKFRGLLKTTTQVPDILADDPDATKEVTEDSKIVKAYDAAQMAYLAAKLNYNSKRIAAASASGPEGKAAVLDWQSNAQLYLMQARAAENNWAATGYRNEVDQMRAYINQATEKSMTLWKDKLENYFDDSLISGSNAGERFYYTTVSPGNFANAGGWTSFGMNHSQVDRSTRNSETSWSAGGGFSLGFWNLAGGASGRHTTSDQNYAMDTFELSFSMTQVQIQRPWFYPEFFVNRGWTLTPGDGWTFDKLPSDGANPPDGIFVGYPMQAIFVKDVKITSASFVQAYHAYSDSVKGSAATGFGPFVLTGSYGNTTSGDEFHSTDNGTTLTVPGMQLIGFVNHLLGKTPNPLPDIPAEKFE